METKNKDTTEPIIILVLSSIIPMLIDVFSANKISLVIGWRYELLVVVVIIYYVVQTHFFFKTEWDPKTFFWFRFASLLFLLLATTLTHFFGDPPVPFFNSDFLLAALVLVFSCGNHVRRLRKEKITNNL